MNSADISPADALRANLAEQFGSPVTFATPVTSSEQGFESVIHFVRFAGAGLPPAWAEPLVIRVKPNIDALSAAQREAAVLDWVADRHYPAPRVLAVYGPGEIAANPAQVMQRAPGDMLLDGVKKAPWTTRRRIRRLATLQAQLHGLDPSDFPGDDDILAKRLRLPRRVAGEVGDAALTSGLERVEALTDRLGDAPAVVCHGDFHPLNAIASGDHMAIIDWSDAALGDRHADVSRTVLLLDLAAIAASNRVERTALGVAGPMLSRSYRRAYTASAAVDPERLALWIPVHLLHMWSQAIAAHAGLLGGNDLAERLPEQMVNDLEHRFRGALAIADGHHPTTRPV